MTEYEVTIRYQKPYSRTVTVDAPDPPAAAQKAVSDADKAFCSEFVDPEAFWVEEPYEFVITKCREITNLTITLSPEEQSAIQANPQLILEKLRHV